jgi:signal transduction histidine kinase
VAEIVSRVQATYAGYIKDKGLKLAVELPVETPHVFCDASHYNRILANLVSNAIKFTPAGGKIVIRLVQQAAGSPPQAMSPEVKPAAVPPQFLVVTSVADTGIGIPRDQQYRVFQKFEQIARTGDIVQSGTGLGLSLCKQLVELNGGTIGFESVENQGSTFYYGLPADLGTEPGVEGAKPPLSGATSGKPGSEPRQDAETTQERA